MNQTDVGSDICTVALRREVATGHASNASQDDETRLEAAQG